MSQDATHDGTGKVSFDHIYDRPDPREFFTTLREHAYGIPELARPHFRGLIDERREHLGGARPRVLDVGCSYGVNAALLRLDTTLDELYDRYTDGAVAHLTRDGLAERDRAFARERAAADPARFTGLDTSGPALDYALAAGYLDDAVHADLESADPTPEQRRQLAGTDLVVSTGCIGYVTEKTLLRVVDAAGGLPWMAHFCLRMFPFDAIAGRLDDLGYETVRLDRPFRQRRFASPRERTLVLDRLADLGVDPRGLEADGWFYAQLHVSRPRDRKAR